MHIEIHILADIEKFFSQKSLEYPCEGFNQFWAEKEPRRGDLSPDRGRRSRAAASKYKTFYLNDMIRFFSMVI